MRAEISAEGVLTVSAENELEAYALSKWSEDNFVSDNTEVTCFEAKNFLIPCKIVKKEG